MWSGGGTGRQTDTDTKPSMSLKTTIPRFEGDIVLLGAGRMGTAMLKGWLKAGLAPMQVVVMDPSPSPEARALVEEHGIRLNPDAAALSPAVLVVAVKPQVLDEVLAALPASVKEARPLVLSIAAGKPVSAFTAALDAVPVVRAMPNTPAAIGKGMTGFFASQAVTEAQKVLARALLAVLGDVVEVASEEDIDRVTAVSGSGPAYVFLLTECLAEAARALGLPQDVAETLARRTIIGAAALMERSGDEPAELRRAVTSPGGTTEAALRVLMDREAGLCRLMEEAVKAAEKRARELAGG